MYIVHTTKGRISHIRTGKKIIFIKNESFYNWELYVTCPPVRPYVKVSSFQKYIRIALLISNPPMMIPVWMLFNLHKLPLCIFSILFKLTFFQMYGFN